MAEPLPLVRPAARPRRKPPVTRTLLPGERAALRADALADLSAGRDVREEPHAAEALEQLNLRLARRCVALDAAVIAVATARSFDELAVAIRLCKRAARR